ncbi:MAG: response regulator [Candidatus Omnitrophota bacterium]
MIGEKILLVDDELDYVEGLMMFLKKEGFSVTAAHNGKEAIGAYIKALYDDVPYSLVLLDMRLPGMNGPEILKVIRQEEKIRTLVCVPVILMTAYTYEKPKFDAAEKGYDDFILKSCSNEELLIKVSEKIRLREKRLR